MKPTMMHRLWAEGLGTFWLVLGGCGSAVFAAKQIASVDDTSFQVGIGYLGVSLAFGLTVLPDADDDTRAALAPLGDLRFVAFHDAYQYLETRFGVSAAGSVSLSDASAPSPARIAELRQAVAAMGVSCALSEPQFDADLLNTVFDGTGVKTAVIDPVGAAIPAGPGFYPTLIRNMGTALTACR